MLLVRIRRCSALRLQPCSTNQRASQSSSSGWVGGSPIVPKSLGVRTRPTPKWYCQTRLTITRAVSGLSRSVNHRASVSRRREVLASPGGAGNFGCDATVTAGTPGPTSGPGLAAWPRSNKRLTGAFERRLAEEIALWQTVARCIAAAICAGVPIGRVSSVRPSDGSLERLEDRDHAVIVVHGQRLELVVVAAGAAEGQAQEDLGGRVDQVVELVVAVLFRVGRLVVPGAEPVVAGGDQGLGV